MKVIICFCFIILTIVSYGQSNYGQIKKIPRIKQNYDSPGYYDISVSQDKSELDPGESLKISLFFTGYGQINMSKIAVHSSRLDFFDTSSYVMSDLKIEGNEMTWGAVKHNFGNGLWIINMGGIESRTEDSSYYLGSYVDVDSHPSDLAIMTESMWQNAPITLYIKLKKNLEPGNYYINFYYTYYNGKTWAGSSRVVQVKVNNFIERHAVALTIVTVVIALLGLIPVIEILIKYYKTFFTKPSSQIVNSNSTRNGNITLTERVY